VTGPLIRREPVEGVARSHLELLTLGMRVGYRPYPGGPPEVGEVVEIRGDSAMVLYVGDRTAKSTRISDLFLWPNAGSPGIEVVPPAVSGDGDRVHPPHLIAQEHETQQGTVNS